MKHLQICHLCNKTFFYKNYNELFFFQKNKYITRI